VVAIEGVNDERAHGTFMVAAEMTSTRQPALACSARRPLWLIAPT